MQSANVAVLFERKGDFLVALYPLIYWELILPLLSSSRSVARKVALLLFHLLLSLARALASNRLPACHCRLFLHSIVPGCFGAANFPLVHRCPGECCGTVMLSGYPKNVS